MRATRLTVFSGLRKTAAAWGGGERPLEPQITLMKTLLILLLAAASPALAAHYSVFRVCEDKHVLRTSDGAEAGHVAYIVVEPASHRVVTTVVTGGVVGERLVALPVEVFTYEGDREITLREITRERLVSAPVIERSEISTTTVVQPTIFERSYTHFGMRFDPAASTTRTSVNGNATAPSSTPGATSATTTPTTTTNDPDNPSRTAEQPGRTTTGTTTAPETQQQRGRTEVRGAGSLSTPTPESRTSQQPPAPGKNAATASQRPPSSASEAASDPARASESETKQREDRGASTASQPKHRGDGEKAGAAKESDREESRSESGSTKGKADKSEKKESDESARSREKNGSETGEGKKRDRSDDDRPPRSAKANGERGDREQ